jgi:hypothetical protein
MKRLLFIITVISFTTVLSCSKANQKLFHHKNWKNIQGTFDLTQCLIDGVDSTQRLRNDGCYVRFYFGYYYDAKDEHKPTLRLYAIRSIDFGEINVEKYNYKHIDICNANLNHLNRASQINYCPTSLSNNCVTWDIISLTSNELIIQVSKFSKIYYCKYAKA